MRADRLLAMVFLAGLAVLPACSMSKVLAPPPAQCFVNEPAQPDRGGTAWRPAVPEDIQGAFESVAIHGSAAKVVRHVSYFFQPAGTYTGAALLVEHDGPQFRAVEGHWQLADGKLDLGPQCAVAQAEVSEDRLRLRTDLGTVLLQRSQ